MGSASASDGRVFTLTSGTTLSDLLFDTIAEISTQPVAVLRGPYFATVDVPIHFSAEGSYDGDGDIVSYEWDFDHDGVIDATTAKPAVQHAYAAPYEGLALVRVTSSDGGTTTGVTEVTVNETGFADRFPLPVVDASAERHEDGTATVSWTPAPDDRAGGYKLVGPDGVVGLRLAGQPMQATVSQVLTRRHVWAAHHRPADLTDRYEWCGGFVR